MCLIHPLIKRSHFKDVFAFIQLNESHSFIIKILSSKEFLYVILLALHADTRFVTQTAAPVFALQSFTARLVAAWSIADFPTFLVTL